MPGEWKARRKHIAQMANLVASGMSDEEARRHFEEAPYNLSRRTTERYITQVRKEEARRITKQRPVRVARNNAKLELVQKRAMAAKKQIVVGGDVQEFSAPDLPTMVRSIEVQNKLLGLNAPEQHELVVRNVSELVNDIGDLIKEFLPDKQIRRLFLDRMRVRAEERIKQKQSLFPALNAAPPPAPESQPWRNPSEEVVP